MHRLTALSFLLLPLLLAPSRAESQERQHVWEQATAPTSASSAGGSYRLRAHPLIRTALTTAASAGAFAYAHSMTESAPDELLVSMAAGVAAGAVAGLVLSDAHPLRVIAGSILATLPAGALATFAAGALPDDEQANIPLIAFSIPHGLLTSAISQNTRR